MAGGMRSPPILKFCSERWVWAPHSDPPRPRSGRTSRSRRERSWGYPCRGSRPDADVRGDRARRTGCQSRGCRSPRGTHFLRKRSRVTISAPPDSAGVSPLSPALGTCTVAPRSLTSARLGLALVVERELQAELDAGIGEHLDRRERDAQALQLVAEAQRDREALFVDGEVPELVLQHDGHVDRVAVAQELRDRDARMPGCGR